MEIKKVSNHGGSSVVALPKSYLKTLDIHTNDFVGIALDDKKKKIEIVPLSKYVREMNKRRKKYAKS